MSSPLPKIVAFVAIALPGLLLVAFLVVNKLSLQLISHRFELPAEPAAAVPLALGDAGRGEQLVRGILGCAGCHGDDLAGKTLISEPGRLRVVSGNVTRFAQGQEAAGWRRALRYGLRDDGRVLWLMPQRALGHLSDPDLAATAAYLQGLAPVDRALPSPALPMLGRVAVARGALSLFDLDGVVDNRPRASPSAPQRPAVSAAYGGYLAQIGRCSGCHGDDPPRAAGALPWPPGPPLAPRLAGHEAVDLGRALRAGQRLAGDSLASLAPLVHRWPLLDDLEVAALWAYFAAPS